MTIIFRIKLLDTHVPNNQIIIAIYLHIGITEPNTEDKLQVSRHSYM